MLLRVRVGADGDRLFLTGRDGLTLYYFTVDTVPGVSACEGDCLVAWPPATVAAGCFIRMRP